MPLFTSGGLDIGLGVVVLVLLFWPWSCKQRSCNGLRGVATRQPESSGEALIMGHTGRQGPIGRERGVGFFGMGQPAPSSLARGSRGALVAPKGFRAFCVCLFF